MITKSIPKFKVNDRVLIDAPEDSLDAKHNGKVGRVAGLIQDWFVAVNVNGEVFRFRPDELIDLS